RILIVGAFRPDVLDRGYSTLSYLREQAQDQRHPLAALLDELQQHQLGEIRIDLAQAEGRAFIDALLDCEPNHLDTAFRDTLHGHTGGHALFTTELLRGMQERGDLVRDAQGYWVAGEGISWQTLPARVEAVIATRLRQLPPEWRALLTLASVEGAVFTVQMLARGLNLPDSEIIRRLSGPLNRHHHLTTPVGVHTVGRRHLARYRFRHQMFQTYLYHQLDPVERAQLHLTVGYTLETLYAEHALEISLPLARHFELGGEIDKAIAYLLEAGRRATHLVATEEALQLLTRGLTLLQQLPASPEREQQEVALQLALGAALRTKGWSSPARAQAFERARVLSQRTGTTAQLAQSLLYLADVHLARGQLDQVTTIGKQLLALSASTQNPTVAHFGHYALGTVDFFHGDLLPARQHLAHIIPGAHEVHQRSGAGPRNADVPSALGTQTNLNLANLQVRGRVWLGKVLWALGYGEQAVACIREASTSARDLEHSFPLGFALTIGELHTYQFQRDLDALRDTLRQLEALRSKFDLGVLHLWITGMQGWMLAHEEHDSAGLIQIQQALDQWDTLDTTGGSPYLYILLADAYLALGKAAVAYATLDQNLAHIEVTGLHFFEAETWRLKGEACRILSRPREAETCFQRALTIAQEQMAKSWELRTLMSLCRLYQTTGQADLLAAARAQLAKVYAWFTEGLDTPDLREATALLLQ
ncbi:MAG: ATP-binding protein, partial [Anaerolineae bacterium]